LSPAGGGVGGGSIQKANARPLDRINRINNYLVYPVILSKNYIAEPFFNILCVLCASAVDWTVSTNGSMAAIYLKRVTVQHPHRASPIVRLSSRRSQGGGNVFPRPWWEGAELVLKRKGVAFMITLRLLGIGNVAARGCLLQLKAGSICSPRVKPALSPIEGQSAHNRQPPLSPFSKGELNKMAGRLCRTFRLLGLFFFLIMPSVFLADTADAAWGTSTVDAAGYGEWTSIAVGTSGAAYISYQDVTNSGLMYAVNPTHTAVTGAASVVSTSGATLGGTANATGLNTTAYFQYGVTSGSYTGTSSTQSVSGTSDTAVSIALSSLSAGTTYYYRLANQHYTNLVYGSEASFSTSSSGGGGGEPVKEKLTISSTSPSSGATGVSVTTAASATFNMNVNGSTVTTETFKLSDENGDVSGSVVTNGAMITFTPSLSLSYGTKYTATVTTKVTAANWAGTTMESAYSWDFTTESASIVTPTPAASPTPVVTTTPTATPASTATPTPTAAPTPSPTVTTVPTLPPPPPTPPPLPTPTVSIAPTPVGTATPAECTADSMSLSSYNLSLKMKKNKVVTVTVTGSNGCLVEGDIVEAKIDKSGKKYVAVSPKRATTDANGQARFKIRARERKGSATVTFICEEMEETVTVKVAK